MSFYQLLAEKKDADLEADVKTKRTDYEQFVTGIKKLSLREDKDGSLMREFLRVLLMVLEENPEKRYDFKALVEKLMDKEYYKQECRKLTGMYAKLSKEHADLSVCCLCKTQKFLQEKLKEINRLYSKISDLSIAKNVVGVLPARSKDCSKTCRTNRKRPTTWLAKPTTTSSRAKVNPRCKLDYVNLYHEPIGNIGAMILAEGMAHSRNLKYLVLGSIFLELQVFAISVLKVRERSDRL
eukprot:TRINITY_DN9215_c0_g4_i3.p1 TRINITY_DN9215_c0_g4~~TRINITY_DN9215_c0_g4_i3.p1  ORF type:complete len:239 (+),score=42.60 TRINITY_DN9215_c0_g4_i3:103-819(+)